MCHNVSEELSYDAYTESLDLINKNRVQIKMSKNSNMPFTVPAKWIAYFYIVFETLWSDLMEEMRKGSKEINGDYIPHLGPSLLKYPKVKLAYPLMYPSLKGITFIYL